jgi:hypothetical protein
MPEPNRTGKTGRRIAPIPPAFLERHEASFRLGLINAPSRRSYQQGYLSKIVYEISLAFNFKKFYQGIPLGKPYGSPRYKFPSTYNNTTLL